MKKLVLLILSLVLFCGTNIAQKLIPTIVETQVSKDTTNKAILKELETIRGLQQEAKEDRQRIRADIEKKEAELKEVPKNEYGAILQVEHNTRQNWLKDDWNVYGWVAFFLAFVSLLVSGVTLWAQWQTEKHTSKAPVNVQLSKLEDLPRHFYRNLVCTSALIFMFRSEGEEKKRKRYPSESNLGKLKTLPDDIVLPVDVVETKLPKKNPYSYMHELKLLLRNYNIEIETASQHISRKKISDDSLKQDYDNLLYKPIALTVSTFDYEKSLHKQKKNNECSKNKLARRTIITILSEHFKKLEDKVNFDVLFSSESAKNYLDEIIKDPINLFKTFVEGKEPRETGSVERAITKLIKYGEYEKDEVEKISSKDAIKEVIKLINTEEKNYNSFFYGQPATEKNIPGILDIKNENEFTTFCNARNYKADEKKYKEIYELIKSYLTYLQKETWDTATLIAYIMTIDAAIETNRIGMVNYD